MGELSVLSYRVTHTHRYYHPDKIHVPDFPARPASEDGQDINTPAERIKILAGLGQTSKLFMKCKLWITDRYVVERESPLRVVVIVDDVFFSPPQKRNNDQS
jgi:predicted pyridoxine 5'-phosphate oxidase superfamily flavin-nucleotide-binding protein